MSDQEYAKKIVEEMELEPVIDEYEYVTGRKLESFSQSERPDFIIIGDGEEYGLELTKVMQDPETRLWRDIVDRDEHMDPVDAAVTLQEIAFRKNDKLKSAGWKHSDRTILVLQLMESPLPIVANILDREIIDELSSTDFIEVWLADYTIYEAYGTVQLYCVKPEQWRGLHEHSQSDTKPYG